VTTVVVLGATGAMGRRVCRLLKRFAPTAFLIGASRSGTGHPEFPVRRADVADRASLRALLRDADLVVNAVGPYRYDPAPLVEACIATRCHYADLADELGYLAALERQARARGAARAGVALVAGCTALPGLVQVLASRWWARAEVVRVGAGLSEGIARAARAERAAERLAPFGRRGREGSRWLARSALAETRDGRSPRSALPFPAKGMRLGARRVAVHARLGLERPGLRRALGLATRALGTLPVRVVGRAPSALAPLERSLASARDMLVVVAEDARGRELERVEVHARAGALDVPALPAVWVARRLVELRRLPGTGLLGLDRVVPFERAVAWLRDAGCEVRLG
jgi:hypothetical protein